MARFSREDGFSLAELIIVIAIVAMVAAAVFGVYDVSQKIYIRSASLEDAQLGARAGLDRMATELRLAGAYLGGAIGTGTALPPSIITSASSSGIAFKGDADADTLNSTGDEITVSTPYSINTSPDLVVNRVTGTDGTTNPFCSLPSSDDPGSCVTSTVPKYIHIQDGPKREVARIASSYTSGTTLTLTASGGQVLTYDYPLGAKVRTLEEVTYTYDSTTGKITRALDGRTAEDIVENVFGLTLKYYQSDGTTEITDLSTQANRDAIREIEISLTTKGSDGSRRTMTSRVRPRNLGLPPE